jgi:hypothetical protein
MTEQPGTSGGFFDGIGGGAPSFKFEGPETGVKGEIVDQYLTVVTDTSGVKKQYPDGSDIPQLNVTLQTELRNWDKVKKIPEVDGKPKDPSEDDGKRRIYVKYDMRRAVGVAIQAAKAKDLTNGGTLAVKQTGWKKTNQPNDLPLYAALYEPPAAGAGFFGGDKAAASGDAAPASAPSQTDEPPF